MRRVETAMLVGWIGLLAIGIWQSRNWLPDLGPHHRSTLILTPTKAGIEQKPKPKNAHGPSKAGQDRELTVETAGQNNPMNSTVVEVPVPGRVSFGDLAVGMTRSTLREQYGEPMFDVTARRDGRLIERYYYLAGNQGGLTVATLHDGKVISTEAIPY